MSRGEAIVGASIVLAFDLVGTVGVAIGGLVAAPSFVINGQDGGFIVGVPLMWHGVAPFVVALWAAPAALIVHRTGREDLGRGIAIGALLDLVAHACLTQLMVIGWFVAMLIAGLYAWT